MRLVRQKPNGCGPACVAMLAGVTLEQAERAIGKTRMTRTADLVAGLRRFGFRPPPGLVRWRQRFPADHPPPMTVLKVHWHHSRRTHWVVHELGGKVLDPGSPVPQALEDILFCGRVTSYLPLRGAP